jgi:hypothetical protein
VTEAADRSVHLPRRPTAAAELDFLRTHFAPMRSKLASMNVGLRRLAPFLRFRLPNGRGRLLPTFEAFASPAVSIASSVTDTPNLQLSDVQPVYGRTPAEEGRPRRRSRHGVFHLGDARPASIFAFIFIRFFRLIFFLSRERDVSPRFSCRVCRN